MINIRKDQLEILTPLIPNIEQLLKREDDEDLLLAIDDLIISELEDNQNHLSEQGVLLQKIYDEIYEMND